MIGEGEEQDRERTTRSPEMLLHHMSNCWPEDYGSDDFISCYCKFILRICTSVSHNCNYNREFISGNCDFISKLRLYISQCDILYFTIGTLFLIIVTISWLQFFYISQCDFISIATLFLIIATSYLTIMTISHNCKFIFHNCDIIS